MPIKFNCHKCGANLRVPEKHIGKKARCPKCDEKCIVPETSQRSTAAPGSALGAGFEDLDSFLDPTPPGMPVGLPPAPSVPPVAPVAAPAMATPVAAPFGSAPPSAQIASPYPTAPPAAVASPYAAPMPQKKRRGGRAISGSVVQPLYDARIFIQIFGWAMFVLGILQLVVAVIQIFAVLFTGFSRGPGGGGALLGMFIGAIIGFIVPFVTTWIGWQIKSAGSLLTTGVESGDNEQIRMSCKHLANYFRVMGIVAIIGLVLMALVLIFVVIAILIGLAA